MCQTCYLITCRGEGAKDEIREMSASVGVQHPGTSTDVMPLVPPYQELGAVLALSHRSFVRVTLLAAIFLVVCVVLGRASTM